jgi:hypothetical protein
MIAGVLLGCSANSSEAPEVLNYSLMVEDGNLSIVNAGSIELGLFYVEYSAKWFDNIFLGPYDTELIHDVTYEAYVASGGSYMLGDLTLCLPEELWSESNMYKCEARLFDPVSQNLLDETTFFFNYEAMGNSAYRFTQAYEEEYESIREFIAENTEPAP